MEFIKERNFIVAYEYGEKVGAWNISTGHFIGKSGKPVKSVPSCFTFKYLPDYWDYRRKNNDNNFRFGYIIHIFRDWFSNYEVYTPERGSRMEQLISVGLIPDSVRELDNTTTLSKEIVSFLKENYNSVFNTRVVNEYLTKKQHEKYMSTLPDWACAVFKDLVNTDMPINYIKTALNRLVLERVDMMFHNTYATNSYVRNFIVDYYRASMTLYGKVEVERNFLTKLNTLLFLEEEYKNAHYNDVLKKNNDLPWLYFENEIFTAKPILTKEDFHLEGETQHNCVERLYMEKVYKGETHIVAIRRKTEPSMPYITCEVGNNGYIYQYLSAFNHSASETAAQDFYILYSQHLNNK